MAVGNPPLTGFAAVHLGGPQRVGARLAVNRDRDVLQAGRVGHVACYVAGLQLEGVGRAVGAHVAQESEEIVDLLLAIGVARRPQDAHGLVARPERPAGGRVAVVQRQLRFVQRCPDPGQEFVPIGHALSMLLISVPGHASAESAERLLPPDRLRPKITGKWRKNRPARAMEWPDQGRFQWKRQADPRQVPSTEPDPLTGPGSARDAQSGSRWRTEIRNSPRSRTLVSNPCRAA